MGNCYTAKKWCFLKDVNMILWGKEMRGHLHAQQRVCRRAILMHTERVCYAFIFEDIANLTNVNLGLEKLRLSPHHLQL